MRSRNFGMRLNESEFRLVHTLADRLGVSTSDAVRYALRRLYDDKNAAFDGEVVRKRREGQNDDVWSKRVGEVVGAVRELTENLSAWKNDFLTMTARVNHQDPEHGSSGADQ